jgi:exonuclease VII large subunit
MRQYNDRLGLAAGLLETLSPLLQLDRGYVIASHDQGGAGLVSAHALEPGDSLWLRFSRGQARARVEKVSS